MKTVTRNIREQFRYQDGVGEMLLAPVLNGKKNILSSAWLFIVSLAAKLNNAVTYCALIGRHYRGRSCKGNFLLANDIQFTGDEVMVLELWKMSLIISNGYDARYARFDSGVVGNTCNMIREAFKLFMEGHLMIGHPTPLGSRTDRTGILQERSAWLHILFT